MMKNKHSKYTSGFTIVELLVVIVVIAILAAITIVSYNGITKRAKDTASLQNGSAVMRLLEAYKSANGHYPTMNMTPGQMYCIGQSTPIGNCYGSVSESDTTVTAALATIGTVPTPVKIDGIGPHIYVDSSTEFELDVIISGQTCPSNYEITEGSPTSSHRSCIHMFKLN